MRYTAGENTKPKKRVSPTSVEQHILIVRGQRVILSQHLADLYRVPVKALNQAVQRNRDRFPPDFMFQLERQEFTILKSQIVTSSWGGLRRELPYAFTEQGVAMLSSVLRSSRAVQVNIEIMRTFVRLRQLLATHTELGQKLEELEKKYDAQFKVVFEAIRELMAPPAEPRPEIGFHVKEEAAPYRVKRMAKSPLRGILKRKPGEKPLYQEMTEHKRQEKELDAARQTRRSGIRY